MIFTLKCLSISTGVIKHGSVPNMRDNDASALLSRPVDTCPPMYSTLRFVLMTTKKGSNAWIDIGDNICRLSYENGTTNVVNRSRCPDLAVDGRQHDHGGNVTTSEFNIAVDEEFLKLKPDGESSIQVAFFSSAIHGTDNITANIHFICEETATPVPHQTTPMPSPTVAPKLCPCSKLPDAILGTQVSNVTSASVHLSTCTWLLSLSLITSVIFVFR